MPKKKPFKRNNNINKNNQFNKKSDTPERNFWISSDDQIGNKPESQAETEGLLKTQYNEHTGSTMSVDKINEKRGIFNTNTIGKQSQSSINVQNDLKYKRMKENEKNDFNRIKNSVDPRGPMSTLTLYGKSLRILEIIKIEIKEMEEYLDPKSNHSSQEINAFIKSIEKRFAALFMVLFYDEEVDLRFSDKEHDKDILTMVKDHDKTLLDVYYQDIEKLISHCQVHIDFIKVQFTSLSNQLPPLKRKEFRLDTFQEEVCGYIENGDTVVLSAPTSSGKSVLSTYVTMHKDKGLIIFVVPTGCDVLAWQIASRFERSFNNDEFVPIFTSSYKTNNDRKNFLEKINNPNDNRYPAIVGTINEILNLIPEIKGKISYIVYDEIHQIFNESGMEIMIKMYSESKNLNAFNYDENGKLKPEPERKGVPTLGLSATIGNPKVLVNWLTNIGYSDVKLVECNERFFNLQNHSTNNLGEIININPLSMVSIDEFISGKVLNMPLSFTPPDVWDLWKKIKKTFGPIIDPNNKSDKSYTISFSKEFERYRDINPNNYFHECYPKFEDRRSGLNSRYNKPPDLDEYTKKHPNNVNTFFKYDSKSPRPLDGKSAVTKRITLDNTYEYCNCLLKFLVEFSKDPSKVELVDKILKSFDNPDIDDHDTNLVDLFFRLSKNKFYFRNPDEDLLNCRFDNDWIYDSNTTPTEVIESGNIYRKFSLVRLKEVNNKKQIEKKNMKYLIGYDYTTESSDLTPSIVFTNNSEECMKRVVKFAKNLFKIQSTVCPRLSELNEEEIDAANEDDESSKDSSRTKEKKEKQSSNRDDSRQFNNTLQRKKKSTQKPDSRFTFENGINKIEPRFDDHIEDWQEELKKYYSGSADELHWLLVLLWHGVGVYIKGLAEPYLRKVQYLALKKKLKFVFSDESLQFGVSMPFKSSLILKNYNKTTDKISYRQMGGRAGRRGEDTEGHVILVNFTWSEVQNLGVSQLPSINGSNRMVYPIENCSLLSRHCKNTDHNYENVKSKYLRSQYLLQNGEENSELITDPFKKDNFYEEIKYFNTKLSELDNNQTITNFQSDNYDKFNQLDEFQKNLILEKNRLSWIFRESKESAYLPLLVRSLLKLFGSCDHTSENNHPIVTTFLSFFINIKKTDNPDNFIMNKVPNMLESVTTEANNLTEIINECAGPDSSL